MSGQDGRQQAREDALDKLPNGAVRIDPSRLGPWQNEEMRDALDTRACQVSEDCAVDAGFQSPPFSPLVKGLFWTQGVCALVTAPFYPVFGLSVGPLKLVLFTAAALLGLAGLAYFYRKLRRGRAAWVVSEVLVAALLLILFTNIASPSQYLAVALRMPLIDSWLAAGDHALGVHVPSLTAWTAEMPPLVVLLQIAYATLLLQFTVALVWLGIVDRDLERLWEYSFHFHFCLVIAVVSLAIFPAECVFTHLGFESLLDQTRFITHFEGLRTGAMTDLRWDDLEGLISMPSFHVAGGLMVTWAFRYRRVPCICFLVLNSIMLASTVLLGAHYFVDLIATLGLFGLSVYCYRRFVGRGWMSHGMSLADYHEAKRQGRV